METKRTYEYTDSEGDEFTFDHITSVCGCFCYSGCHSDTLIATDDEGCQEYINLEFRSGKELIDDMIIMLLDAGKIKEVL